MADKNVIGILFGVQGEGSIDGASGRLIQDQLREIAKNVNLQVKLNINKNHFKEQLADLKKDIDTTLGSAISNAASNDTNKDSSNKKSKSLSNAGKDAESQAKAYRELVSLASDYGKKVKASSSDLSTSTSVHREKLEQTKQALAALNEKLEEFKGNATVSSEQIASVEDLKKSYEETAAGLYTLTVARREDKTNSLENTGDKLISKAEGLGERYSSIIDKNDKARSSYEKLQKAIKEYQSVLARDFSKDADGNPVDDPVTARYNAVAESIEKLKEVEVQVSGEFAETFRLMDNPIEKIKKSISTNIISGISTALIGLATSALKKVYTNVVQLDKAVTDLQIATGYTREETQELVKSYALLAQQMGSTISDVSAAADTWLRQGYSIEETNILIANSMMLSKLGQIDSTEASKALTSAMKGYKVAVEDSMSVVDKFTAVDMEAAVSAGDIATAMAETAASADVAGVSMDKLIGYISTVAEVTQDGAESVGTFYKTLFARMGNVKAAVFVDDETGESLNDVEKTLSSLGVALRDNKAQFRDFDSVLDEVASKWNTYSNVQQHALATAFAGTRQQEKFIVLMENYGAAMDYANTAAKSSGTASEKYTTAYLDSIEAKVEQLTAAWEEFSLALLESDFIKLCVEGLTRLANVLTKIVGVGDGAVGKLLLVFGTIKTISAFLQKEKIKKYIDKLIKNFQDVLNKLRPIKEKFTSGLDAIKSGLKGLVTSSSLYIALFIFLLTNIDKKWGYITGIIVSGLFLIAVTVTVVLKKIKNEATKFMTDNWVGWILALLAAIATLITSIVKAVKASFEKHNELKKETEETAKALQEEADALKEVSDAMSEACDNIDSLIEKYEELGNAITAAEWSDTITSIGEDVKSLFPEDTLSDIEAINKLLGTTYSYSELINMDTQKRADLLEDIVGASRDVSSEAAKATYEAQKTASKMSAAGAGLGSVTSDEWEDAGVTKGADKRARVAIGKQILDDAGISAEIVDGTADRQLDYTLNVSDVSDIHDNIQILQKAVQAYEARFANSLGELTNDLIYKELKSSLDTTQQAWDSLKTSADKTLSSVISSKASEVIINEDAKDIKAEYDRVVQEFVSLVKSDSAVSEMISDGVISDDLTGVVGNYIAQTATEFYNQANKVVASVNIQLKSTLDILEEMEGAYGTLTDAMEDMSETGILSANTIKALSEAGMLTDDYVKQTADGYTLKEGVRSAYLGNNLQSYTDDIVAAKASYDKALSDYDQYAADNNGERRYSDYLKVIEAQETLNDALQNGESYLAAISTMGRSDLLDQYKELLEEQSDLLDEQLDKQRDLADLRKEILESYQEQVDYQNELEKKERKVSMLRAQLAVSQLDTSAAGQARSRSLTEDLSEAEEDLDDYTLENAIDTISAQIDDEMTEYESFIEGQVKNIEEAIKNITNLTNDDLSKGIAKLGGDLNTSLPDAIVKAYNEAVANASDGGSSGSDGGVPDPNTIDKNDKGSSEGSSSSPEQTKWGKVGGFSTGIWGKRKISFDGKDYEVSFTRGAQTSEKTGHKNSKACMYVVKDSDGKDQLIVVGDGFYRATNSGESKALREAIYKKWGYDVEVPIKYDSSYHTGGFVGDETSLKSNEEYAKLLKGEFVSTPAQMEHFMKDTFPGLVASIQQGGGLEINSPLIKIDCGSVTKDSLPELEEIVNAATKKVINKMNDALTRSGYKKTY